MSAHVEAPVNITDLSAHLVWQHYPHAWVVAADHIVLNTPYLHWKRNHLVYRHIQQGATYSHELYVQHINLAMWSHLLVWFPSLNVSLKPTLTALQPQGDLQKLYGVWKEGEMGTWSAELHDIKWQAWHNIPAVDALSGTLKGALSQGKLTLNSHDLTVHAPLWQRKALHWQSFFTNITWQHRLSDWSIHIGAFRLHNKAMTVTAEAQLHIPKDKKKYRYEHESAC